jgi:hypothetical protein
LDTNELLYKQCFYTCKKCDIGGNETNHNCLECKEEYNNTINISIYKNCYNDIDIMSNILQETEEIIETFYHQENTYFQFITSI